MATAGSHGQGDAAQAQPPNNRLQRLWTTIYTQINDLYYAKHEKAEKIDIHEKNSYHILGADDKSKSVISLTYSADKLCETMFHQFSRSCVKLTMDKKSRKVKRLLVTREFNSQIG